MRLDRTTLAETGLAMSNANAVGRAFNCRIVSGPASGTTVAIGARPVRIGAGAECEVLIDDPQLSRQHAELIATDSGAVVVRDLGSTNGTFVDAVRITEALATAGSSIRCGSSVLKLASVDVPTLPPSKRERFGPLAGTSRLMRELFAVLELSAPTDVTLLIRGESGTGKELAARGVHDHSPRAEGPLVVVDCGAISPGLIESELFGHTRGAFTGATTDRDGAFVKANGGTIFLDEIGELPKDLQPKLLRVLEAKTVRPVGSTQPVSVDVRLIAATHRDLFAMASAGTFRLDLFHRLAVIHAVIPPLRDRRDELPTLIQALHESRGAVPGPITGPNLERLKQHHWPGNVRELRNVLERAWVLSPHPNPTFEQLDIWLDGSQSRRDGSVDVNLSFKEGKEQCVREYERLYLQALIERHPKNLTLAAEKAGIDRRHLRRLLQLHGLRSTVRAPV